MPKEPKHAKPTKKQLKAAEKAAAEQREAEEKAREEAEAKENETPDPDEEWYEGLREARDRGTPADPTHGRHERRDK